MSTASLWTHWPIRQESRDGRNLQCPHSSANLVCVVATSGLEVFSPVGMAIGGWWQGRLLSARGGTPSWSVTVGCRLLQRSLSWQGSVEAAGDAGCSSAGSVDCKSGGQYRGLVMEALEAAEAATCNRIRLCLVRSFHRLVLALSRVTIGFCPVPASVRLLVLQCYRLTQTRFRAKQTTNVEQKVENTFSGNV
jgi:hypothetical protein